MLSFSPITLDSMERIRTYLDGRTFRTSDYAPGAIFQWRAYTHAEFAVADGMLVMTLLEENGQRGYMYPVGSGSLSGALDAIEADAAARHLPLQYSAVPEEGVTVLQARYGARATVQALRQWADYLYELSPLITFPGKKYHAQRNHFNRFCKDNPAHRFVPVTAETLPAAERFLKEYQQFASIDKPIEEEEMKRARELLHDMLPLRLKGGYIETEGTIVALAIGEVCGDTLFVHVEKARTDYMGAYQAIVSEFAEYAAEPDTLYINREDDSGDEGLRYSKMVYRPLRLLDKYWITVKE